jgi:hypothetical protein
LQQAVESCLLEMVVGRGGRPYSTPPHDNERGAIDQAPELVWPIDEQSPSSKIDVSVDEYDVRSCKRYFPAKCCR